MKPLICYCIGGALLCYSTIVYVVAFAVPCAKYNAAKGSAQKTLEGPSKTLIAFHWILCITGIAAGVLWILAPSSTSMFVVALTGSLVVVVFWALNMGFFFSSDQYAQKYTVMTIDQFKEMNAEVLRAWPKYSVFGKGERSAWKSHEARCRTSSVYLNVSYVRDDTPPLELNEDMVGENGIHIITTVNLEVSAGQEYLQQAIDRAAQCVKEFATENVEDTTGESETEFSGLVDHVLVTRDGRSPKAINKHAGRAAAVFGPAIAYSYNVARQIPYIHYTITKLVEIGEEAPLRCSEFGKCVF